MSFEIVPYGKQHAASVNQLVLSIQQEEFGVPITLGDQPDLQDVDRFFRGGLGNFWVAVADERVVGTIALVDIGSETFALRKMFVHPDFRGGSAGVAKRLLDVAFGWAEEHGFREIVLGTTDFFHAAHRFYEKHGFTRIDPGQLPPAFPKMKVDSVFYSKPVVRTSPLKESAS